MNAIDTQKTFFEIFKSTKKLDELCRLFIKIKPKESEFELFNLDAVGLIKKKVIAKNIYDYPNK